MSSNHGIVLHKLELIDAASTQSLMSTTMLRGEVVGCWLSNKNDVVLAVNGSSSSRENGKTTFLATVEILEDSNTNGADKDSSQAPPQLTLQGLTNTTTASVAAAACGDDTVTLAVAAATAGSFLVQY